MYSRSSDLQHGEKGESREPGPRRDDPPWGRQRGALSPAAPTEAGSSPAEQGICSWNNEGKSQSCGPGFSGAAPGVSSREHCCDHLVAQKPGSWRSLALAVRFGAGHRGVVRAQLPEKGSSAGPRNGQRWDRRTGHLSMAAEMGLEPHSHAHSCDTDMLSIQCQDRTVGLKQLSVSF